jgi:LPXTG-motif cell wall-anchored protein
MKIKPIGIFAMLLGFLFMLGFIATGGIANADPTVGQCGDTSTSTTRPDNGHFGPWATLVLTRSVHVCRTADSAYTGVIADNGSLTTLTSKSPRTGVDLVAGVKGTVLGTYNWTFTAESLNLDNLVSPAANTATGDWLKELVIASGGNWGAGTGHEYTWTYTTCAEKWIDASNNNDGLDVAAGDITGIRCISSAPTFIDGKCQSGGYLLNQIQFPYVNHGSWTLNGTKIVQGPNESITEARITINKLYTVKLIADSGFKVNGTNTWTHTFTFDHTKCVKAATTPTKPKITVKSTSPVRPASLTHANAVAANNVSPVAQNSLANTGTSFPVSATVLAGLGIIALGTGALFITRRKPNNGNHA